jgi:hypothetical protein
MPRTNEIYPRAIGSSANDTTDYVLTYLANHSKVHRIIYHKQNECVLRRCQNHTDAWYEQRTEKLSNKFSTARNPLSLKGTTEAVEKIDLFLLASNFWYKSGAR